MIDTSITHATPPAPNLTGLPLHIIPRDNNRSACFFAEGVPLTRCHEPMPPMVHRQRLTDLPRDVGLRCGYTARARARALPLRISWNRQGVIYYGHTE